MSPLVSQTATIPNASLVVSAEAAFIGVHMIDAKSVANDQIQTGKRSLLERRRKRQIRRWAH